MNDLSRLFHRREFLRRSAAGAAVLALPRLGIATGEAMRRIPASFFGLHMVWPVRQPYVENFPSVPFTGWRALLPETHWFSLEPRKGEWHFEKLDIAMRLMESRGVDVLLTLCGTPTWASSKPDLKGVYVPGEYAPPRDLKDWEDYVRKVVERYRGRIRYYELWNEPAVYEVDGVKAHFTAAKLVELGRSAYRIIKEVDPAAKFTSPPMVGWPEGVRRMEAYLAAGGGECMDIVSYHFYGVPDQVPQYHAALVKVLARYGLAQLPIWNTEFGYLIEDPTAPNTHPLIGGAFVRVLPDHEAAAWLGRSMITAASLGIERFFWYMWDGRNMALINYQDRKINAAGIAYGTVAAWLTGRLISALAQVGDAEYCRLADDRGLVGYLAWSRDYKARTWKAPAAWDVRSFRRLDGQGGEVTSDGSLELSAGPVFLLSGNRS